MAAGRPGRHAPARPADRGGLGLGAVAFRYLIDIFTWLATGRSQFGQQGRVASAHLPWLGRAALGGERVSAVTPQRTRRNYAGDTRREGEVR